MIKSLSAPYVAGRRGQAWQKIKPAYTLDLVVLVPDWEYGRRTGYLSNLLRAARDEQTVYPFPELVVEIALDGVQISPRYPGGAVLRYRPDKDPPTPTPSTPFAPSRLPGRPRRAIPPRPDQHLLDKPAVGVPDTRYDCPEYRRRKQWVAG